MKLFLLAFYYILLFCSALPVFGETQKNKLLFLSPVLSSKGDIRNLHYPALLKEVSREAPPNFVILSSTTVETLFLKAMEEELEREMAYAQDAYFSLKISDSIQALEGRTDIPAILLRALIFFSNRQVEEAQRDILSLVRVSPFLSLSSREFPPHFLKFFEGVRQNFQKKILITEKGNAQSPLLGNLDVKSEKAWRRRFQAVMARLEVHKLLIIFLEPVGWNQKLRIFVVSEGEKSRIRERQIEFVGKPRWHEAAKILVNTMVSP